MYGGVYAVKAEDAVTRAQFESGMPNGGFIRLEQKRAPAPPPPPPAPQTAEPSPTRDRPKRTPVKVERTPLEDGDLQHYIETMESKTIAELKEMLDNINFGPDELSAMLTAEKAGKERIGAVKILEKYLSKLSS
jgi:hypothetical protein